MEVTCSECGFKKDVGKTVDVSSVESISCPKCGCTNVVITDTSGIKIRIDGISEEMIINIIKELGKNVSIYDVFKFFKPELNTTESKDETVS